MDGLGGIMASKDNEAIVIEAYAKKAAEALRAAVLRDEAEWAKEVLGCRIKQLEDNGEKTA